MASLTKTMLIEICDDVLMRATKDSIQGNEAKMFLMEMASAAKRGTHIIYVPGLGDNDLTNKLREKLGASVVSHLIRGKKNRLRIHTLLNALKVKAVCSYNKMPLDYESSFERVIFINPDMSQSLFAHAETYLIGENHSDTEMFMLFAHYYIRQKRLDGVHLSFYPLMGGGATSAKVYGYECKQRRHFCLAIADSDYKSPCIESEFEIKLGGTATKIRDVDNFYKDSAPHCCFVHMKKVSEIENLIPSRLLRKHAVSKDNDIILAKDYSFIDIKKGITYYSMLANQETIDYYKELYGTSINLEDFDSKRTQYYDPAVFKEEVKDRVVLAGWGSGVLDSILNDPANRKELENITRDQLTPSQQYEWESLGESVFNWTCALKPQRT